MVEFLCWFIGLWGKDCCSIKEKWRFLILLYLEKKINKYVICDLILKNYVNIKDLKDIRIVSFSLFLFKMLFCLGRYISVGELKGIIVNLIIN